MARPPVTKKGEKTMTFVVRDGHRVTDFDGIMRDGGDRIELTKGQAKHLQALNCISVDMGDIFDEGEDNEPSSEPKGDTAKAGSGASAEGGGEPVLRGPSSAGDAKTRKL